MFFPVATVRIANRPLWRQKALDTKARSPEKFMCVSDVKVWDGALSSSMPIKATSMIVKE